MTNLERKVWPDTTAPPQDMLGLALFAGWSNPLSASRLTVATPIKFRESEALIDDWSREKPSAFACRSLTAGSVTDAGHLTPSHSDGVMTEGEATAMQVEVTEDTSEPTALALAIARRWVDPAATGPVRATIRQVAEAMTIDTTAAREGLRELVTKGIVVVERRACCSPRGDLCDPGVLLDNEHFELTQGWAYLREIRTPRPVPSIAPTG